MAEDDQTSAGWLPRLKNLPGDALAGVINAVMSVPSGMATAALAGVNPVYGLYATVVAPTVGGLFASSQLMQIATTGASALAAGQAVARFPEDQRAPALFVVVLLAGVFLVGFGILGAGKLVRYISYPVMTAFLSGVAAVLVMDQAAQLAGYSTTSDTSLGAFVELILNIDNFSWNAVLIGSIALAIMIGLSFTRLANTASLVALVIPTGLALWWQLSDVELVEDISEIPSGLIPVGVPDLSLITLDLVASSFAVAVIIAIQGAGVSQSIPNPDGSANDASRDMLAQGVGNTAASFFNGMPTGASVGQTALNTQVGARSRYSMIFHGLVMLLIIVVAAPLVGLVPMTVLAAIMMVAGFRAIQFRDLRSIWRVRGSARWPMVITFSATLLTSIPMAVGIGVLTTLVLFIYRAGQRTRVSELVREGEDVHVKPAPAELASDRVTVLDVHGPLYFAAARTLRERLPLEDAAERAVVVLRLRDNTQIGATFIEEVTDYARTLRRRGGRLYLCGMTTEVVQMMERSGRMALDDEVVLVPGEEILGASLREAVRQAQEFLEHDDE